MNTRGIALVLSCLGVATGCQYSRSPDVPSSTQTTGTVIETPVTNEPRYGNFTPHPVTAERQRPQRKPVTTTSAPAPKPAPETHETIPPPAEAASLTPLDQGNSSDETKITAAIRREMMNDKGLSFTAKNANIITQGKNVTLRGTVKTEAERATIEAIARRTEGVAAVVNQLEVKP